MELAILAGIGLVGYYFNNGKKRNKENTPNYYKPMSHLLKNNITEIDEDLDYIYSPTNKHDPDDNIILDEVDLLDISEKLTDNSNSINKILAGKKSKPKKICKKLNPKPKEPAYLSQFDVQTFDSEGLPSAPNDTYRTNDKAKLADLERKLSYQGGWSQYGDNNLTYGVMPDDQLTHNNMVPYYSTKHGYGSNDIQNQHVMDYKKELFTGSLNDTWNNKQECKPHFKPTVGLSYMYGTPVRTDEELERYIPGRYRQNDKPFDDIKVTPGLGLEANEVGTHGLHPMWRDLGKTVDELRVKPKITYEGRTIGGMKGQKRPNQAPIMTYKPPTYKTNTKEDLLPTSNTTDGPKVRDNFMMKETDRSSQHIEYTGGAYTSQESVGCNVPENMRAQYKYSTKQNFTLPEPLQKFSKIEATYNPNLQSYDFPYNARAQTSHINHIGSATNATGMNIYSNLTDITKTTNRETIENQAQTHITSNTMRGTVHPMDIANPTIREITAENRLNPHVTLPDSKQRVYYSDIAKTTNRESTCEPVVPINVTKDTNIYANWMDLAKTTNRETTVIIPHSTTITPINQQTTSHPQDITRTTNRETVLTPWNTNILPVNQLQGAPHPQDITKTTLKETFAQTPRNNFVTPINQNKITPHPQDIPKTTTKETINIPYNNNITPIDQFHGQCESFNRSPLKTTIKEAIEGIPQNTNVFAVGQNQPVVHPRDIAKTTGRETISIPYNTNLTAIGQLQQAPHPQDNAKTTMRETINIPYNTNITGIDQLQGQCQSFNRSPLKTTMKEAIEGIPYNTHILAVGQEQPTVHPQDIAKTTTRETINIPYNTHVTGVGQTQQAPHPQDIAKTTIRETTNLPYNTHITGATQSQTASFDRSPLRTTIRESTVGIPHNTHIFAVDQTQPTTHPQDIAKTTSRETINIPYNTYLTGQSQRAPNPNDVMRTTGRETISIPYNTNISIVNQLQGNASAFDRTPFRQTIKETTIDNNYIAAPTNDVNAKGYGYLSTKIFAPATNKQDTCQQIYITPLHGNDKARTYTDAYNAQIDDRKDILHQYRPPTNCGANKGPTAEQLNVSLKDDNNVSRMPAPGFTFNNNLDRMKQQNSTKEQNCIPNDRFIDPVLLEQLLTNQLNIPNFYSQNINVMA